MMDESSDLYISDIEVAGICIYAGRYLRAIQQTLQVDGFHLHDGNILEVRAILNHVRNTVSLLVQEFSVFMQYVHGHLGIYLSGYLDGAVLRQMSLISFRWSVSRNRLSLSWRSKAKQFWFPRLHLLYSTSNIIEMACPPEVVES